MIILYHYFNTSQSDTPFEREIFTIDYICSSRERSKMNLSKGKGFQGCAGAVHISGVRVPVSRFFGRGKKTGRAFYKAEISESHH